MPSWLIGVEYPLWGIAVSAVVVYLFVMIFTRLSGLRSFAKMSAFDFAITVAIGSMISTSVLSGTTSLLQAAAGIGALYVIQHAVGFARERWGWMRALTNNQPVLLMDGAEFRRDAMSKHRVSEDDIWAKLREANVLTLDEVRAVVLESTGDVSVLHGRPDGTPLDKDLLTGVATG